MWNIVTYIRKNVSLKCNLRLYLLLTYRLVLDDHFQCFSLSKTVIQSSNPRF